MAQRLLTLAWCCRHMSLHAYRVVFFERASQISNAVWDACFRPPAEGGWWYETLDQSGVEDQFTFFYGLIEHLGRPVGIAPGFVMDLPVEQVAPQELFGCCSPLERSCRPSYGSGPYLSALRSSMKAESA